MVRQLRKCKLCGRSLKSYSKEWDSDRFHKKCDMVVKLAKKDFYDEALLLPEEFDNKLRSFLKIVLDHAKSLLSDHELKCFDNNFSVFVREARAGMFW